MQIIHYVPCRCQHLDSCECGVTASPGRSNSSSPSKTHTRGSPSISVPTTLPVVTELSTIDKIYYEVQRAGLDLSFFLANYQFTAFTATLTSQWRLSLLAAVIITNVQHGVRSLLVILVAWPANVFLGYNFTRLFSAISYTIGVILIYGTYPSFVSTLFVPGLVLVTLGQCMTETADTKNEAEEVDDEEKGGRLALKNLWLFLKRHWSEVIGFFVAVFFFPGQEKGLWIIIWMLLASSGLNLVGQLCIKLRNDGIGEICGLDVLRKQFGRGRTEWSRLRYIWRDTVDKKQLLRTLLLSLVFLPYVIMSEVGDTYFFQQVQEMKPVHIFGKSMPTQAVSLLKDKLGESLQWLSHWLYTKTDDGDAPRTRFYGTLRVGLANVLAIPCFVIASVVETKRWEDDDTSVIWLIPQLILIAIVDGLAMDGIECFFKLELPDSLGRSYGKLFVKGIVGLGKLLTAVWNVFWSKITRTGGNPGWLDEKDDHRHRLDRYYSVMAIFADVSCIIYVCVAYRYSVKYHKWSS